MPDSSEVWFREIYARRFIPVHWKGFVLLLVAIAVIVPSFYYGYAVSHQPALSALSFTICIAAFFLLFAIARRHSG
jgi:uncharacterized membrane protein YhaH (DUF805 family)